MRVTRIVHPVGQGAFYTEKIEFESQSYNVVYDCGSGNGKNASVVLNREIASSYSSDDVIDILFISHFDNDHINGIKELEKRTARIRNIVVPLIEPADYWFYCIETPTFQSFYEWLGRVADKVYRVRPNIENGQTQLGGSLQIDISENNGGIIDVNSATMFRLQAGIDWCYIPFNYDQKVRIGILREELNSLGLHESVFEEWEEIEKNIDKIKAAYKNVVADGANKTSLILYSGGINGKYHCHDFQSYYCYSRFRNFLHYGYSQEGCLYFGDNDLNQANILDDLKCKLNIVKDRIRTFQLPHHGAKRNFNAGIFGFNSHRKVFFVSFKCNNMYAHPSTSVVTDVLNNDCFLFEVTEKRDSTYIQFIERE